METFKTNGPAETELVAFNLAQKLPYGKVIAMFGDLGAGKNCLHKRLCKGNGN